MDSIDVGGVVKTSIVTGFTIAVALMWKDIFSSTIKIFFPEDVLFYQFLGVIIATVFAIIAIYVVLKTEYEAETIIKGWRHINKAKRKKIIKEIKQAEKKAKDKNGKAGLGETGKK